ncbi:hypothetical protein H9P43_001632 [Blastocladiella emersonii ATCC 22665]|nr:hypothetical protein H9P43_001632 [Blastocladiella emersonii ATCC 22665]
MVPPPAPPPPSLDQLPSEILSAIARHVCGSLAHRDTRSLEALAFAAPSLYHPCALELARVLDLRGVNVTYAEPPAGSTAPLGTPTLQSDGPTLFRVDAASGLLLQRSSRSPGCNAPPPYPLPSRSIRRLRVTGGLHLPGDMLHGLPLLELLVKRAARLRHLQVWIPGNPTAARVLAVAAMTGGEAGSSRKLSSLEIKFCCPSEISALLPLTVTAARVRLDWIDVCSSRHMPGGPECAIAVLPRLASSCRELALRAPAILPGVVDAALRTLSLTRISLTVIHACAGSFALPPGDPIHAPALRELELYAPWAAEVIGVLHAPLLESLVLTSTRGHRPQLSCAEWATRFPRLRRLPASNWTLGPAAVQSLAGLPELAALELMDVSVAPADAVATETSSFACLETLSATSRELRSLASVSAFSTVRTLTIADAAMSESPTAVSWSHTTSTLQPPPSIDLAPFPNLSALTIQDTAVRLDRSSSQPPPLRKLVVAHSFNPADSPALDPPPPLDSLTILADPTAAMLIAPHQPRPPLIHPPLLAPNTTLHTLVIDSGPLVTALFAEVTLLTSLLAGEWPRLTTLQIRGAVRWHPPPGGTCSITACDVAWWTGRGHIARALARVRPTRGLAEIRVAIAKPWPRPVQILCDAWSGGVGVDETRGPRWREVDPAPVPATKPSQVKSDAAPLEPPVPARVSRERNGAAV